MAYKVFAVSRDALLADPNLASRYSDGVTFRSDSDAAARALLLPAVVVLVFAAAAVVVVVVWLLGRPGNVCHVRVARLARPGHSQRAVPGTAMVRVAPRCSALDTAAGPHNHSAPLVVGHLVGRGMPAGPSVPCCAIKDVPPRQWAPPGTAASAPRRRAARQRPRRRRPRCGLKIFSAQERASIASLCRHVPFLPFLSERERERLDYRIGASLVESGRRWSSFKDEPAHHEGVAGCLS